VVVDVGEAVTLAPLAVFRLSEGDQLYVTGSLTVPVIITLSNSQYFPLVPLLEK